MLDRRIVVLACVLMLGCDSGSEPSDTAPESESASDSATDGESDGDTDIVVSSGSSTSGSVTSGTSTGAGGTGGESSTGTGPVASCDLNEVVCDAVEGGAASAEDVVDCGTVVVEDEASAWVDMHDCVLDAAANQQLYKGFVHRNNGLWEAFGAVAGPQYSPQHWILTDIGTVMMERCSEPTALPDCEPGPETGTCVVCFGEGNQVCPAD